MFSPPVVLAYLLEKCGPSDTSRVPTNQEKKMASSFASILRDAQCGSIEVEDEEGICVESEEEDPTWSVEEDDEENTGQQRGSFRFGEMEVSKEKMLRSTKFDVGITEIYELSVMGIFEVIGVNKSVAVSAFGMKPYAIYIAGIPSYPSFVPGTYSTFGDDMTFWKRVHNFKLDLEMRYHYYFWELDAWSVFNDACPGFPDLRELFKQKTGIVLLNVNEFTEAPRPTANIIRYIGGLAIPKPKELNQNLNELLNKRSQNVLFSLGSSTQAIDMPNWLKMDIISAFESFPNTTFIWKYEGEIDSNILSSQSNIYTMKWVPQADLLGDRRLSAFITHAGMNSVHEATYFGKPMIAIPLFGDQFRNAENLRRRGLAVMINRPEFSRNTLTAALREVLSENSTVALKAAKVARHLSGRPALARAETSKWVRLVAEQGPMDHLILQSRNMSLIQYYNIDVIGYLLAQFAFALFIVFKTASFIVGKVAVLFKYKTE